MTVSTVIAGALIGLLSDAGAIAPLAFTLLAGEAVVAGVAMAKTAAVWQARQRLRHAGAHPGYRRAKCEL
jgi:hypothetical protein